MPAIPDDLERHAAFDTKRRARQKELDRLYEANRHKTEAALAEIAAEFAKKHGLDPSLVTMTVCQRRIRHDED